MLLNRENKENRQVVLTIQVEQSAWEKALEDAYEQSKSLFKKEDGSLPTRQEMEEKHGADVFYQDAVNSTFPVALVEAVRQEDISVAGAPELSVEAIGPEGYVFTALIDLYPEVKLGQYKGLSAPRPQVELSDDDVTAAIDEYLQGHLTEEHPKKAAMGDEVVLDFEGFVNGVPFEGGKAEEYPLLLGSGYFIPGFEEQVAGMAVGDERDIPVTFPTQYAPELAGKDAVFHIKVHKITRRARPVMSEEFAKSQGFADASALRRSIMEQAVRNKQQEAADAYADALVQQVIEGMEVEIPERMVTCQLDGLMHDLEQQLMQQGATMDAYLEIGYHPGADAQTLAGTILNDYGTIANTEMLGQVKLGDLNAYGVNGATVQKQLEAYLIQTADGCVSVVLCRAGTAPAGWYESLLASAQTLQITG